MKIKKKIIFLVTVFSAKVILWIPDYGVLRFHIRDDSKVFYALEIANTLKG